MRKDDDEEEEGEPAGSFSGAPVAAAAIPAIVGATGDTDPGITSTTTTRTTTSSRSPYPVSPSANTTASAIVDSNHPDAEMNGSGHPSPPPSFPLPEPPDRVLTERSAAVVEAAIHAPIVGSSDSVLSRTSSEEQDDEKGDEYGQDGYGGKDARELSDGSSRQPPRRRKPRESSFLYMQNASVEVDLLNFSGDDEEDVNGKGDNSNTLTLNVQEDSLESSWSQVFHESHTGSFREVVGVGAAPSESTTSSVASNQQQRNQQQQRRTSSRSSFSSASAAATMNQSQNNGGRRASTLRAAAMASTAPTTAAAVKSLIFQQQPTALDVLRRYEILVEEDCTWTSGMNREGDQHDESEAMEPILLHRLLVEFATTYRHDPSALQATIRASYPGWCVDSSPKPPEINKKTTSMTPTRENEADCNVVRFLTAGYPSEPALLQCPPRCAAAFLLCVVSILTSSHESESSGSNPPRTKIDGISKPAAMAAPSSPVRIDSRVLYASARFQSHPRWKPVHPDDERPALAVTWDLWRRLMTTSLLSRQQHLPPPPPRDNGNHLCEALGQLAVVLGVAGVTPRILREMLALAGSPTVSNEDRWALVRAVTLMADGANSSSATTFPGGRSESVLLYGSGGEAVDVVRHLPNGDAYPRSGALHRPRARSYSGSHDLVVVASPPPGASSPAPSPSSFTPDHFFIWTGRPEGRKRKISGLASWPFRNDFGLALWFRADHLDPSRYPVLLSYRAETATSENSGEGGVDVSLVPLGRGTGTDACTIQVSVYDYDRQVPAQTLHVPGCVLLGSVWYHLAVRHSNARLKGVFSLSSRQQVTILVNGKVVLHQPLVFPKISASDTIQSESALLPAMVRAAAVAAARRPSVAVGGGGMYSCTWTLCSDFEGQTSSIIVFNDNISDAALRALYQATGGSDPGHLSKKPSRSLSSDKDRWDSRKSDIVKKSRVLDANLMSDDADEVVLSQRRATIQARQKRNASIIDVVVTGNGSAIEDDPAVNSSQAQFGDDFTGHGDLLKPASFGSKVFLVWDPKRSIGSFAVEVHVGAHLSLGQDSHRWEVAAPQDVIGSFGGVQSLVVLFRSMLEGEINSANGLTCLILLLRSFLQSRDDNAREFLRCGGVDVIEQLIYKAGSKLLRFIHAQDGPANDLVMALMRLRSACDHYVGLETKVFSRLVFNLPLWLGTCHGDCLHYIYLPVLSAITKSSPDKVRDCVGVRDMIQVVLSLRSDHVESTDVLQTGVDFLLGMMFEVLSCGVTHQDMSPFLCGISMILESSHASQSAVDQRLLAFKLCSVLLLLLQIRPPIAGLFESFAYCCGSVQAAIGWLLCSMVKSPDDNLRSIGIRCVAEYLDVASSGADYPLTLGSHSVINIDSSEGAIGGDGQSSVSRLGRLAKGFVVIAPAIKPTIVSPSRQTPRVVVKLLWHLLKSHRDNIGEATHSALLCWIGDDGGTISTSLASLDFVRNHAITKTATHQPGWRFDMEWVGKVLAESGSIVGRSLRNPLGLASIIRLIRYLNHDVQDRWLTELLTLARANRKSMSLLSSVPDWQPCLFHLISETLEILRSVSFRSSTVEGGAATDGPILLAIEDSQSLSILSVGRRLDLCVELYSTLLGHLAREGGDKSLDALEKAVSLQRICVNGHDVVFLILSGLCENLFDYGTILDIGSISAQDWKDVDFDNDSLPLKQSARLVTDAILSNGAKGLDMPSAVKSWRSLRHLAAIVAALCAGNSFGVVDLFDYNHRQAAAIDKVSGGLHGIRLSEGRVARITYATYLDYVKATGQRTVSAGDRESIFRRDMDRRFCTHLSSQVFTLLDAFIFPESLDEVLPTSQLHSLALVRHSEPRLGPSQGPLVASAMRLSSVLLALLEPGSVKLLQCASRMRCLVSWALEMEREYLTSDARAKTSETCVDLLDQLFIGTLMHCHRALGRCSCLLSEIESTSFEKYFDSRDSHKKHHRRLLRTSLEIRDVVLLLFRGCQVLLTSSLSSDAFDALRNSLEGSFHQRISKESVAKDFLASHWVTGFQDVETRRDIAIPEQLSMGNIPLSSEQVKSSNGIMLVEKLAQESKAIAMDLERTLDGCFEEYLEATRLWAETDAVRDLEYEGDNTVKRLAERYSCDYGDMSRGILLRRNAAESRSRRIFQMTVDPWDIARHWKLANSTDRTGTRALLVPNRKFTDHKDASYELTMEKEREKAEKERRARLREKEMSDVMRRNAEAFAMHDSIVMNDVDVKDDDSSAVQVSDGESSEVGSSSGVQSVESVKQVQNPMEVEREEDWDRIETDEYIQADSDADIDAWAKQFIWADGESVVARFENVIVVSLCTYVEGKILLTTHGLYFQRTGDETSVITKYPVDGQDPVNSDSKNRRWRVTRLMEVHGRRYLLREQALELFFADGQQLFLNFPGGPKERDRFYAKLRNSCKTPMLGSLKSLNPRTIFRKTRVSELWQQRKISNFDYLMAINRMAGRSFNDITQYPVFPWVLVDYTSETLDLNDTGVFRDLSKPIGALNSDRLAQLLERYRDLELFGFSEAERFLYGSHYSSPGIVLHYLIRQEPFTTMAIELQSGRFDCPDRLFFDIAGSWNGCLSSSSDMKELIPEFYCLPEMFLNTNKFPLGRTQGGRAVDDVGLPPWAKGSAYEFVRIHRLALESEYVSQNLHSWIDLIFGFKQRGPEAEASHNLFHHLSYEGAVDLDKIADKVDRQAAESHIQNFGQTPSQLIVSDPHPSRHPAGECWKPLIYNRSVPRNLRCYTPSKQFGNKGGELANGAVLKISVLSETLLVVYSDMSVGTYRWHPNNRANRLRMDKLRPMPRRELSTSRSAIKRGSTIPEASFGQSGVYVGNWSFAVTIGGYAKEELRRKAILPSGTRLMTGTETTLASAETSGYLVSCGFWDDTINVHSIESHRLLASESGGHRGLIRCFAEDDGLLVTGGEDTTCRVWVLGHPDMAIALADGYVQTSLGVSNDGDQLLSCCHVLWGHDSPITALGVDSDLDVVASGSQSGLVCIHTIRRGEFIRSFYAPSLSEPNKECRGTVRKIALDSTGNMVIHMNDYGLHAFTVNAVLLKSVNAGELILDMTICSRGEILITGGMNCQVMIRSVHDLQVLSMLDLTRHGPIRCVSLTPDDLNPTKQFLFVGSDDGMITIVDEDPAFAKNSSSVF